MATVKLYLDCRSKSASGLQSIKLMINHKRKTALLRLNVKVKPEHWDAKSECITYHESVKYQKMMNLYITSIKQKAEFEILIIENRGEMGKYSIADLKNHIENLIYPEKKETHVNKNLFANRFLKFANSKIKGTKNVYMQTYRRMVAFVGEKKLRSLSFEDVDRAWLKSFEEFLARTACKNARNIHLRNIRAVFNDALDDEIIDCYPFRRFKIHAEPTAKRNLPVEQLREFFNYTPESYAEKYLDMFKLIFMLIGINVVDLAHLKEITNGRVEFKRAKTRRLYSIKVEPEAKVLIDKLAGKDWLVHILDKYSDHNDYTRHINRELKKIGGLERKGLGGKKIRTPMFPKITTYWARHSWATIAASLDIPKDTIAHALGHGNNTVTDIYIDFDQSKVDEANRKVLDWVLYEKR